MMKKEMNSVYSFQPGLCFVTFRILSSYLVDRKGIQELVNRLALLKVSRYH